MGRQRHPDLPVSLCHAGLGSQPCAGFGTHAHPTYLTQILMTFENLAAWGHCLCAVCPSPTTIVTSGSSAVVCVWELSMAKGRPRGLHLKEVWCVQQPGGLGRCGTSGRCSVLARPTALTSRQRT